MYKFTVISLAFKITCQCCQLVETGCVQPVQHQTYRENTDFCVKPLLYSVDNIRGRGSLQNSCSNRKTLQRQMEKPKSSNRVCFSREGRIIKPSGCELTLVFPQLFLAPCFMFTSCDTISTIHYICSI